MLYFMDEDYCHAKQHLPYSKNGAMNFWRKKR
jgi:hypothetical protein